MTLDLYRTGNADGPSRIRFGLDIVADAAGYVHPGNPPQGLSTYNNAAHLTTKGRIWRLPLEALDGTGLVAVADPPPPDHWLIVPAGTMPLHEYLNQLDQLAWIDTGQKKR